MSQITVTINGEPQQVAAPLTIYELLVQLALADGRVAVEHNRRIVKREAYLETAVNDGDQLEIIHFVGGGAPK